MDPTASAATPSPSSEPLEDLSDAIDVAICSTLSDRCESEGHHDKLRASRAAFDAGTVARVPWPGEGLVLGTCSRCKTSLVIDDPTIALARAASWSSK